LIVAVRGILWIKAGKMLTGGRTAFTLLQKKVRKFTKQFNGMSLLFQLIGTGKQWIIIGKTGDNQMKLGRDDKS